ncbi:MAG: MCE family protein [Planctomycetia bacterium]|nr:MCE family protein [Planctomycetia bacterium]
MDERVVQFRVGVMVLASLIIAGILVVLFGSLPSVTTPKLTIYISFPQATGVSRDTPVRRSGILIGHVTEVEFADDGSVLVTAEIYDSPKWKLFTNEVCQVSGSLLGGDAVIQFVGTNNKPREPVTNGARFVGLPAVDPLQALSSLEGTLTQAVTSVTTTSDEIGRLARRVSDLLESSDEQVGRVATKAEDTLDRLNSIAKNTDYVLGDEKVRDNLKQAFLDLPDVIRDTREAVNGFKTTLDTADRNLQNIEGLTKPLGQRGGQLVENIERTTQKLDRVLTEMSQFSAALNNPRGSIGQLLDDPDLYRRIKSAVTNIETLTQQMRPIIRDARVFSDKISRHPEVLGIRGAIAPSSGAK